MSTRANIRIRTLGADQGEEIQLYRHCDGYPTSVLPSLVKAFEMSGGGWPGGRAGQTASFICAAGYNPEMATPYTAYEPEQGTQLHPDVEWVYVLTLLNNPKDGKIFWKVEVSKPLSGFWDDPTFDNLKLVDGGPLYDVAARAETIEGKEDTD